ncbi:MAG TPA: AAA family ATPase [Desulfobacteraceae bacterium]|nr:AAA family ATPase [Desulfobacteraceae bacterium]
MVFPKTESAGGEKGKSEGGKGSFDLLPEELERYLERFVVKQQDAKAVLSTKVCTHFNRIAHFNAGKGKNRSTGVGMIKNNVLMIGPTGVGKTYIIKLIAQKLGVPFVKGDATKFSETGYVGGDVEDLVRDLVYEAGDDISAAENGIIYIDEIDKIASSRNIIGHDVSRTGVQRALLKPMEETDVDLKVPHDPVSQIQAIEHFRRTGKKEKQVVNTRNILFIMSGAFGDLTEIIRRRLQKQGIGFEADVRPTEIPWEILKEVKAQDLIEFGFESEFVGRLPVVVVFDELTKEDLFEILSNPNNPIIISKRLDFSAYGIEIKFQGEALEMIAEMAAAEKTGARGIVSAIERVLIPFEKRLPSTAFKKLLVTPELVKDPEGFLADMLEHGHEPAHESRFEAEAADEMNRLISYMESRIEDFRHPSGVTLSRRKMEMVAELYLKICSDLNRAFEEFIVMYEQVKEQESAMRSEMDLQVTFDETAVEEIIQQAIVTGEQAGPLAQKVVKRLEYGLKLVKDRAGVQDFVINDEAVKDMEFFINKLIKQCYRQEDQSFSEAGERPE